MRNMNNAPNTITSALEDLGAELGISEADFDGKVKIEGKDPVVASRHRLGESTSVLLALFGMELAAIWKRRPERCVETGLVRVHTGDARKARGEISFQGAFTHRRCGRRFVDRFRRRHAGSGAETDGSDESWGQALTEPQAS